jgi:hypothetical protein
MYRITSFMPLYGIGVQMTQNYKFLTLISATRWQHKAMATERNKKCYKVNTELCPVLNDPHFLNLGTSWRWMVSFTPLPLYSLNRRLGGHQRRSGRRGGKKILDPTGTRTPIRNVIFIVIWKLETSRFNKIVFISWLLITSQNSRKDNLASVLEYFVDSRLLYFSIYKFYLSFATDLLKEEDEEFYYFLQ